jgi:hypothetical protein
VGVQERRDAAGAAGRGGEPEGAGVRADERGGAVGGGAGAAAGHAGLGALLREPQHRAAPQARRRRRPHHHPARLRQPPLHPHVRRRRQEPRPLQGRRRLAAASRISYDQTKQLATSSIVVDHRRRSRLGMNACALHNGLLADARNYSKSSLCTCALCICVCVRAWVHAYCSALAWLKLVARLIKMIEFVCVCVCV